MQTTDLAQNDWVLGFAVRRLRCRLWIHSRPLRTEPIQHKLMSGYLASVRFENVDRTAGILDLGQGVLLGVRQTCRQQGSATPRFAARQVQLGCWRYCVLVLLNFDLTERPVDVIGTAHQTKLSLLFPVLSFCWASS